jgi:hypothetical protein
MKDKLKTKKKQLEKELKIWEDVRKNSVDEGMKILYNASLEMHIYSIKHMIDMIDILLIEDKIDSE